MRNRRAQGFQEWQELLQDYEWAIFQRANGICISCGGLFYKSAVMKLNEDRILERYNSDFLRKCTPAKTGDYHLLFYVFEVNQLWKDTKALSKQWTRFP